MRTTHHGPAPRTIRRRLHVSDQRDDDAPDAVL
jgi:hypothetical protein